MAPQGELRGDGGETLRRLPRVRDSWSYLYAEHCHVEQDERAIALHDSEGKVPVPCASLLLLLLGPGTTVTHAAMRALAESGCLVAWTGEEGVRFYAQGQGSASTGKNAERQARLWAAPRSRHRVAEAMYRLRFAESELAHASIEQLRGREGVRVREAYARASQETGVPWKSRSWNEGTSTDPVNRALSWANACLYGICHTAIVAAGYLPSLGFIHAGHARSFVFDIADLYKADLCILTAFETVQQGMDDLETRRACGVAAAMHFAKGVSSSGSSLT